MDRFCVTGQAVACSWANMGSWCCAAAADAHGASKSEGRAGQGPLALSQLLTLCAVCGGRFCLMAQRDALSAVRAVCVTSAQPARGPAAAVILPRRWSTIIPTCLSCHLFSVASLLRYCVGRRSCPPTEALKSRTDARDRDAIAYQRRLQRWDAGDGKQDSTTACWCSCEAPPAARQPPPVRIAAAEVQRAAAR